MSSKDLNPAQKAAAAKKAAIARGDHLKDVWVSLHQKPDGTWHNVYRHGWYGELWYGPSYATEEEARAEANKAQWG